MIRSSRWWQYQRERFPLLAHGLLVMAFSFSAVAFSSLLRGDSHLPQPQTLATAFVSAFIFFMLLRIADEFKDYEEDCQYRSYRPVPRGLISLRDLGWLALGIMVLQFLLAVLFNAQLLVLLVMCWFYLALMSKEFFVAAWLKRHPVVYMWSHMLIMPLIDFYATAVDWLGAGLDTPPPGLFWFLMVSFFNGMVIEIGRKIRAPEDEEQGVETYSVLWGRKRAVVVWLAAMAVTAFCAAQAAVWIHFISHVVILLGILLALALFIGVRFLFRPLTQRAKMIEHMSGVWTLLMYLSLGVIPLILAYTNTLSLTS